MYEVLLVLYLLVALSLIGLVLLQRGKGADMGASFGAGASGTLFGASGSGNFLTRTTAVLATSFFILSLLLGNLTANAVKQEEDWNNLGGEAPVVAEELVAPAAPAAPEDAKDDIPN
ncbi:MULTISPECIES: preprotein translocase subunit SecG [Corallincola]|uniref:Protein-export membrane protein SecG n=3 Tax=Corallincola TaxID=1775176 RepID=A0A368N5U0_9GAMM|nr:MULTISPECIES: preprotein translocase subunit SecG [Corallincola]RCU44629.1 preprotein translocase subunit SecG [Corallincola holothuriorum]TAA40375.1 preprotein translocase subunit SecG [Corallincola spongiicola]TCI05313.1 preprotein translocase subunit SecG [Corallincola luteus]